MKNIQSSCRCKHNWHKENDAYRLLKSTIKPVNGITLRIFPRIGISHSMKGFIYTHLKTIFWNGFGTFGTGLANRNMFKIDNNKDHIQILLLILGEFKRIN